MLDRTEAGQSVDVLAEILGSVRVEAAEAAVSRLGTSPFEDIASSGVVIFVALSGRFRCDVETEQIDFGSGDALAILHGAEQARLEVVDEDDKADPVDASANGGDDTRAWSTSRTSILRCACRFADPERNPLLGALPRSFLVTRDQWSDAEWIFPLVTWIVREAASTRAGAQVVIHRLLELLWIQLVRTHVTKTPSLSNGWLRALSDAQIGGALSLIHEKPAEAFTVAGLAQAVGMSRSAFASQFTRLVGEPPLHYVARWRMLKASQLLKEDKQTLAEVANSVGYESEAAFSKAFKRWSGKAPGSYRRDRRTEPALAAQLLAG